MKEKVKIRKKYVVIRGCTGTIGKEFYKKPLAEDYIKEALQKNSHQYTIMEVWERCPFQNQEN